LVWRLALAVILIVVLYNYMGNGAWFAAIAGFLLWAYLWSHSESDETVPSKTEHRQSQPKKTRGPDTKTKGPGFQYVTHEGDRFRMVNTVLKFDYRNRAGEESTRTIEVKGIRTQLGHVLGYCHLRQDLRTFAMHKMRHISDKVENIQIVDVEKHLIELSEKFRI
jgi:hypothetical protein